MRLMMANRSTYYVSLGDSMSIDAYAGGAGCGAASLFFHNRDHDFPEWAGRDLRSRLPDSRLIPMAMDGATSATLRYAQIPRLKEMRIVPSVVTLTIGGNDLLQAFGNDDATKTAHQSLRLHGRAALTELRTLCGPKTPILLGTIYDPSDGTGDAVRLGIASWPASLEWLHQYNETLRALAKEFNALLADIHAVFYGHGLTVGSPAQTEPRPAERRLYYCGVVEPNAWGASALRELWWHLLVGQGFTAEGAS